MKDYLVEMEDALCMENGELVYQYLIEKEVPVIPPCHFWTNKFFIPFRNMGMDTNVVFFCTIDDCPYISTLRKEIERVISEGNFYSDRWVCDFLYDRHLPEYKPMSNVKKSSLEKRREIAETVYNVGKVKRICRHCKCVSGSLQDGYDCGNEKISIQGTLWHPADYSCDLWEPKK